jgi:hypothetical protein
MKKLTFILLLSGLLSANAHADDMQDRSAASRAAVKEFAGTLQGELQAAMKAGGPVNALGVCREKAPAIAADISKAKGWRVIRTSLKTRNAKNAPDAWETKVLQDFEKRKAAGEDPAKLEYSEMVMGGGKHEFRYMKAIVIAEGAPCLACHGDRIAPDVAAKLKTLYPDDKATGYKTGDVRGAFSISQPM